MKWERCKGSEVQESTERRVATKDYDKIWIIICSKMSG